MQLVWSDPRRVDASTTNSPSHFLETCPPPLAKGEHPDAPNPHPSFSQAAADPHYSSSTTHSHHIPLSLLSLFELPVQRSHTNDSTMQRFMPSTDTTPQLFVVVPQRKRRSLLNPRREVRIVAPCQGPSVASGMDDSLHMTNHGGYSIKCPCDFEHRHRERVKVLTKVLECFIKVLEIAGGFFGNVPGRSGNIAISALSSIYGTADNKALLNAAGIDPDKMFEIQVFTDWNQREAIEEILQRAIASDGQLNITGDLRSIVLEDGRTLWVCSQCYNCLQKGRPLDERGYLTLPQYIPLVALESEVQVTLHNALSVTVLTESLSRSSKTKKLIIRIEPEYFEAPERTKGTRYNSTADLFSNLGQAIQRRKRLAHLELHGNSANGSVYGGLNAVFECRSLETLRVSGIPCLLQSKNIKMKCRKLKRLSLQSVPFNMEHAAKRLWELIGMCPDLAWLKLTQARFSVSTLSMDKPKATLTQFARLETLGLSSNDLGGQEATDLVTMALASDNPRLKCLDLSGNTRIGNHGCESVLGLLWKKKCWLDTLQMEGTGIDLRTSQCVNTYLSHHHGEVYPAA